MIAKKDYCRDKSAPDGSSLYYATLYESDKNKQLIYTLFALHYEFFDCLTVSPDPGVTRIKLHWWQEEIGRLSNGSPRHPVSTALEPIINSNPLIIDYIKQHYLCIESLLSMPNQFASISEWKLHWYSSLGQFWMCTEKLIEKDNYGNQIIKNGGIIFTLDILQNFYLLSNKLHGFLPMELLGKYGLQQEVLKDKERKTQVCEMFGELIQDISDDLKSVYTNLKKIQKDVRPYHAIMNRITYAVCKEILNDGNHIMQHKVAITPLRKLWISWRTKIRY